MTTISLDNYKEYKFWRAYYKTIDHKELLDELVVQHHTGFPLRTGTELEQQRHKALVNVAQEQSQSALLKKLIKEFKEVN